MRSVARMLVVAMGLGLLASTAALAAQAKAQPLPTGTDVTLVFDQAVSSKTAKVGDVVKLHVKSNVMAGRKTILRAGAPVTGVIAKAEKRKPYGVNAIIRLAFNPVKTVQGATITLEPRTEGAQVGGEKSGKAAGATVGGAMILGPIGLVGGYFVSGKAVNIKVGDTIVTQIVRRAKSATKTTK